MTFIRSIPAFIVYKSIREYMRYGPVDWLPWQLSLIIAMVIVVMRFVTMAIVTMVIVTMVIVMSYLSDI